MSFDFIDHGHIETINFKILINIFEQKIVKQQIVYNRGCQSCTKNYLTSNFLFCKISLILQSQIWLVKSQKNPDNNSNF